MDLRITLEKRGPYSPGEIILGKVLVLRPTAASKLLPRPISLILTFDGHAEVKFTLSDKWGYKGTRWRTHSATSPYFHFTSVLATEEELGTASSSSGGRRATLPTSSGISEFPFTFTLPQALPSSYKGTHGSVDYTISAVLRRTYGPDKEAQISLDIQSDLDLSQVTGGRDRGEGVSLRRSEKVGMWWWGGTVWVDIRLRKKGYLPGDYVNFCAHVINDSKSALHKAKLLLTQEVTFSDAVGVFTTVTHVLKKVKGPGLKGGERRVNWEDPTALKIPPLPPTNLGEFPCPLIKVNYFVTLLVQPSSLSLRDGTVLCKLPITIGTKRGPSLRSSWCGENRCGSVFSTLDNRSSLGDWNYYQNVIFPLRSCLSAPIYENHSFSGGTMTLLSSRNISPFSFPEEDEPPSYEEATGEFEGGIGRIAEIYENSLMAAAARVPSGTSSSSPATTILQEQPLYSNTEDTCEEGEENNSGVVNKVN